MALPSTRTGWNAWMPSRWSVGARFRRTGWSRMTSSSASHTSVTPDSTSSLAALIVGREALLLEAVVDERLEELDGHLLRKAGLVELELRADHDDRAAGVVDALAEQVLAEPPLLALQRVGQRLQRPVVRALEDAAAAAVVEERVDGFLEHALLVADDDLGRAQLEELLQPVVAVDDAAVEVVQVGGREPAAVQGNEGPQLRRNDRDDVQDHPVRAVARAAERVARPSGAWRPSGA